MLQSEEESRMLLGLSDGSVHAKYAVMLSNDGGGVIRDVVYHV